MDALAEQVRLLREETSQMTVRVQGLTDELHKRTHWWRACVAIGILLVLGISGGALVLDLRTRSEIADADRQLCPMVALLIPNPATRPATKYAQEIARQAQLLYDAYGCGKGTP